MKLGKWFTSCVVCGLPVPIDTPENRPVVYWAGYRFRVHQEPCSRKLEQLSRDHSASRRGRIRRRLEILKLLGRTDK